MRMHLKDDNYNCWFAGPLAWNRQRDRADKTPHSPALFSTTQSYLDCSGVLHRTNKFKEDTTVRQDRHKGWLYKTEPLIIHIVGLRPHSDGRWQWFVQPSVMTMCVRYINFFFFLADIYIFKRNIVRALANFSNKNLRYLVTSLLCRWRHPIGLLPWFYTYITGTILFRF